MYAFRDQNGKILALCVHFQAQSGDSGYMARESCHQGPLFASRARKSCMARRCCQRCPAFRGGGPRPRACELAEWALRPAAGPSSLAACAAPCRPARSTPSPASLQLARFRSGLHHASRTLDAHRSHLHRPSQSGGGWRAAATRTRGPPPIAAIHPRAPPPAACARHPRPAPSQTSGTVRPTQCGHKNGTPERGSH